MQIQAAGCSSLQMMIKLEIMAIKNMKRYVKKLTNIRNNVFHIGQFVATFEILFRQKINSKKRLN